MLQVKKLSVYKSPKLLTFTDVVKRIAELKKNGKTVGMCHGGFDLLHPGHIKHFESAKKFCDILLVSITSDRFVSTRKGKGRPIFSDKLRAYMIAHMDIVDYVTISDYKKGVEVIQKIKPTYYIKGPDFIGKKTPGITAERQAIVAVGGKMMFTNDAKLSTTEIIDYIKKVENIQMLVIVDRDGTLITNDNFFGKEKNWKEELRLNNNVVSFLSFLQTKYKTTTIVVSNQSGVARGYLTEERVKDINNTIDILVKKQGVTVDAWQFCPYVDSVYVRSNPELKLKRQYIDKQTKRKPSPDMVLDTLQSLGKNISEFQIIVVLGDRKEDEGLATNLHVQFINVKGKTYEVLMGDFLRHNKDKRT